MNPARPTDNATAHAPQAPGLLSSDTLAGAPHAFTTRIGGHSTGIFSSLNFGNPSELVGADRDPRERIARNWALVLDAIGTPDREIVQVHQVHGDGVLVVRQSQPAHATHESTKADAMITDDPTRVLAVRVADCCPVLLATDNFRVVGAAHAGWRGVVAGVVPRTIEAMRTLERQRGRSGEHDASIIAVIGPCISAAHFEVGPEVAARFSEGFAHADGAVVVPGPKARVSLQLAIAHQLRSAGVARFEVLELCTFARPDLFFSHRRDKGLTGRMAAIIGPRA